MDYEQAKFGGEAIEALAKAMQQINDDINPRMSLKRAVTATVLFASLSGLSEEDLFRAIEFGSVENL